jgi:BirA family biotin operon repressor/biotin-[acetyl-CoA-carboxylase] ligase
VYASLITEWDPLLPFRAGVAVADVLRAVGIEARLKWPNDVLVGEKKIGGILIDATGEWAIVGVGVNHETAPVAGATCVAGETRSRLSRDRLLNMILEQFARLRRDEVLDRYRGLCDTIGRIVLVCTPRGVMRGKAVAVDAQGRLLIEGGRTRQAIDFGECVHVSNEATA